MKRLDHLGLPIDPDAFFAHQDEKYTREVGHIMDRQTGWRSPTRPQKFWPEEWPRQSEDEDAHNSQP